MRLNIIALVCSFPFILKFIGICLAEKAGYYNIKLTKIECFNVDPQYILNLTCYVKAARGRNGLLNVRYTYNYIPKSKYLFKICHRNTAGVWQSYIVDMIADVCDGNLQLTSTNPIIRRSIDFFRQYDTSVGRGCPIYGYANYTDVELDDKATALFPPIIPAGTFMFHERFFHPVTNKTFLEVKIYFSVKTNTRRTAMDLSMLNMG